MELKPGTQLRSRICSTAVVVVRPPNKPVSVDCGGVPMAPPEEEVAAGDLDPAHARGTQVGKRYADPHSGLELLCTKAGDGSLSIDGVPLAMKDAKPLPSSD